MVPGGSCTPPLTRILNATAKPCLYFDSWGFLPAPSTLGLALTNNGKQKAVDALYTNGQPSISHRRLGWLMGNPHSLWQFSVP